VPKFSLDIWINRSVELESDQQDVQVPQSRFKHHPIAYGPPGAMLSINRRVQGQCWCDKRHFMCGSEEFGRIQRPSFLTCESLLLGRIGSPESEDWRWHRQDFVDFSLPKIRIASKLTVDARSGLCSQNVFRIALVPAARLRQSSPLI
jgi:hypothetical protein